MLYVFVFLPLVRVDLHSRYWCVGSCEPGMAVCCPITSMEERRQRASVERTDIDGKVVTKHCYTLSRDSCVRYRRSGGRL